MYRILLAAFLGVFTSGVYAQNFNDLIVTTQNDSIRCRITREESDRVYFIYKVANDLKNRSIARKEITFLQKNYFASEEEKAKGFQKTDFIQKNSRFLIGVQGGFAYRIARIPDGLDPVLDEHFRKMKSGFSVGGDAHYFIWDNTGLGIKYSFFWSRNIENNISATPANGGPTVQGSLTGEVFIHYIAPSFIIRFEGGQSRNLHHFYLAGTLGYMTIKDKQDFIINKRLLQGSTLGSSLDFFWEPPQKMNRAAFGIGVSVYTGVVSSYTINGQKVSPNNSEDYENLSRIDFTLGIRLH